MTYLINQVLILLESDPGRLIFHIVLTTAAAGALLVLINQSRKLTNSQSRRLWIGLTSIFLLQMIQYALYGLTWQGLLFLDSWLPLLDRLFYLLSIMLIVWLWGFPERNLLADRFLLLFSILILSAVILTAFFWNKLLLSTDTTAPLESTVIFNGSLIDWVLHIFSLIILSLGFLLIIVKRHVSWGFGLLMLVLLGFGHIAHLAYLPYGDDYPTFLRLFQMAAYPFLLILPLREGSYFSDHSVRASNSVNEVEPALSQAGLPVNPGILQGVELKLLSSLMDVLDNYSSSTSYQRFMTILAEAAGSDFSAFFSPPDGNGFNHLLCGYSSSSNGWLGEMKFDSRKLPVFNACLKLGRIRSLSASSSSPDRQALADAFNEGPAGPMLFVPVVLSGSDPTIGVILIRSDHGREWSSSQQDVIGLLARYLFKSLAQAREIEKIRQELTQAQETSYNLHSQAEQALKSQQKLNDTITILEEDALLDQGGKSMNISDIDDQAQLNTVIEELRFQNQTLKDSLVQEQELADQNLSRLQEDLRLANEEIASLKSTLLGEDQTKDEQTSGYPYDEPE